MVNYMSQRFDPLQTNEIFHKTIDAIRQGWSIVYVYSERPHAIVSKIFAFLTFKIEFVLANSANPNKMPHTAFHLCFHSLAKHKFCVLSQMSKCIDNTPTIQYEYLSMFRVMYAAYSNHL